MSLGRGLAIAFGIYTVAAVILLHHPGFLAGTSYLGNGADPSLYIWMFRFLPLAVTHLQNPFVLQEAWAPVGLNITQATTTPMLALLAWPITAAVGPVAAFNIVSIATPALAATSCFAFAATYAETWGTAFVAGWLFGFSTYVFAALLGHLQVAFIAFVPLAFLVVRQRAAEKLTLAEFFCSLTLILIAQFLTSLETFVTETIFLFLFTCVTELAQPDGIMRFVRLRSGNLVIGLIAVYAAVGIAMSPFIFNFFRDYTQMPHTLQNGGYWSLDLLDFMVPTPVTWLGGHLAWPIARHYTGNLSEDLGYIGMPLLLLTLLAAWRLRRDTQTRPLLAVLSCGFIFTIGPRLHILGWHTVDILPWALMSKLPLLQNAEPGRLMVFVLLALSGLCACWIDRLEQRRAITLCVFAGAVACTLPATLAPSANWSTTAASPTGSPATGEQRVWSTPVPTAQLFGTDAYRRLIRQDDTVLFLPLTVTNGAAMFWQLETNGYFRMINGYGNFIPRALEAWPAAQMLKAGAPGADFPQLFGQFARATGIDEVVIPASLLPVWNTALERSGWRPQTIGDLTVFTAPLRLAAP
ncbi:MAG: hypothetical protein P4L52_00515 [Acidocella sp.]|nr:hypothetical protein [Acidocella sp.]